jgi:hypothetical protein
MPKSWRMKKERMARARTVAASRALPAPALAVATVFGAACTSLEGPELDDPSVGQVLETATRSEIGALAIGLVAAQHARVGDFIEILGTFGREGYTLPPAEPRPVTERLIDPLTPFNSFWFWPDEYELLAHAFLLLDAIDASSELGQAEKEAARGFTKTFMATAYFQVIITRTPLPIPIDVNRPPTELAPLEPEEEVYRHILELFDEAEGHLRAGGSAFPFDLPPGFSAFETPAAFARVNRALKVRALKYRGRWADVLAGLPLSFFDEEGPLELGAYLDPSFVNFFALDRGAVLFAHPRLLRDAERRADGSLDLRAASKLSSVPEFSFLGITVTEQFDVYVNLDDPLPWIRNEELLLIRAEANLALGNTPAAIRDLNIVRGRAGGLEALPDPFPGNLLQQLLYEKRYSLMWEGGFTYLDARQYDRMGDDPAELPRAAPNHVVYPRFPYPINECQARDMLSAPGCQPVVGF